MPRDAHDLLRLSGICRMPSWLATSPKGQLEESFACLSSPVFRSFLTQSILGFYDVKLSSKFCIQSCIQPSQLALIASCFLLLPDAPDAR